MKSHIFSEGSNTTADSRDVPVKEYYEGLFRIVAGLNDDLSELMETRLHILSEEYGIAGGEVTMSSLYRDAQVSVGKKSMVEQAKAELLNAAADADVMVILLSADVFQNTVSEVWDQLVDVAKTESVWCLGAAKSSLDELDLDELEAKGCTVLTYRRVGVARIGSDTREELIELVEQRAIQ